MTEPADDNADVTEEAVWDDVTCGPLLRKLLGALIDANQVCVCACVWCLLWPANWHLLLELRHLGVVFKV